MSPAHVAMCVCEVSAQRHRIIGDQFRYVPFFPHNFDDECLQLLLFSEYACRSPDMTISAKGSTGFPSPGRSAEIIGFPAAVSCRQPKVKTWRRAGIFAGLQQRLEPRENHRPATIELGVGAFWQLVVRHPQQAGIADRFDLPGHPRGPFGLHVLAPQSAKVLHEPARRIDLDFAFEERIR